MATYSSILAWEVPWTEKPGRLWSMKLESDMTVRMSTDTCKALMKHITFLHVFVQSKLLYEILFIPGAQLIEKLVTLLNETVLFSYPKDIF